MRSVGWSFLLILALLWQSAGWFSAWRWVKYEARQAARIEMGRIPLEQLVHLTLPKTILKKIRVERDEIRYRGQMFDICKEKSMGDSVELWLYRDIREQHVFARLRAFIGDDAAAPRHVQRLLISFLGAVYLPPAVMEWQLSIPACIRRVLFENPNVYLTTLRGRPPFPPPEIFYQD